MPGTASYVEEPWFSVVIPTFQEAENVEAIVADVLELGEVRKEVLVVDDDSPDGTWRIARDAFEDDSRVRVIRRTKNPGLGQAVQRGFAEARGEFVAVIDADFQHPPAKLRELFLAFEDDVDLVIGSRYVDGGGTAGWSRSRQLISRAGALVSRLGVAEAWRVSDPMSGFFAVRRSLLDGVELRPDGYKILLEVLAKTDPRQIVEVPYVFRERRAGESKLDRSETMRFLAHASTLSLGISERVHADVTYLFIWFTAAALFNSLALAAPGLLLVLGARAWDLGTTAGSVDVRRLEVSNG